MDQTRMSRHHGRMTFCAVDERPHGLAPAGQRREAPPGHRFGNVIPRSFGSEQVVVPDALVVAAPVGRLLLCSDGSPTELSPTVIGGVLAGFADPLATADRLVPVAPCAAAGDDTAAVVVAASAVVRAAPPSR